MKSGALVKALFLSLLLIGIGSPGAASTQYLSISKTGSPLDGLVVGDTVNICLEVTYVTPAADIMWVFDASASMEIGRDRVIADILTFTAKLQAAGLDYRNGLAWYDDFNTDFDNDPSGSESPNIALPFDTWAPDDVTFSNWLSQIATLSGGIEHTLEALTTTANFLENTTPVGVVDPWRTNATRTMIFITDEGIPCADKCPTYPFPFNSTPTMTLASAATFLNGKGITVHGIAPIEEPNAAERPCECDPPLLPPMTGGIWQDYNTSDWGPLLDKLADLIIDASNVVVTDPVPSGLSPIPASVTSTGGVILPGNTVQWTFSTVGVGEVIQLCFDSLVDTNWGWGQYITNTASAEADDVPPVDSNEVPFQYATPTPTPTYTATPTATDTFTSTPTYTPTPTATPTWTPTSTPTFTRTLTFTNTFSFTATPTWTPTWTQSFTSTWTPTWTPTATPSWTPTATPTFTPSQTFTPTYTATPTYTRTDTPTFTVTFTGTPTASPTSTATPTFTATPTATPTATFTPTYSATPTHSPTSTITQTFTVSPTYTASPPVMPYEIVVGMYNSAGERVRTLISGQASCPLTGLRVEPSVLVENGQPVSIVADCMLSNFSQSLQWNGDNDNGQPVQNGTYHLKADIRDQFGKQISLIRTVTVARPLGGAILAVYNSAGEVVYEEALSAAAGDAVTMVLADAPVMVQGATASPQVLKVNLATSGGVVVPWSWNGLNNLGLPVQSGSYSLRLVGKDGGVTREEFVVLAADEAPPGLVMAPSPGGQNGVWAVFEPRAGATVVLSLYTLAAEKVRRVEGSAATGRVFVPTDGLSAGIYVASLEVRIGNAVIQRDFSRWVRGF